eukprot:jgi/Orpsp1_1/1177231/evm.model.c7180000060645.1
MPVGMILGWLINQFFYSWYSKKIYSNIKRKFNKQHVIEKLKEQEEKKARDDDPEDKPFEAI